MWSSLVGGNVTVTVYRVVTNAPLNWNQDLNIEEVAAMLPLGQSMAGSSNSRYHIPKLVQGQGIWGHKSLGGWAAWEEVREVAWTTWKTVEEPADTPIANVTYLLQILPQRNQLLSVLSNPLFLNPSILLDFCP